MATEFWRKGKFSDRNNKINLKDYFQTTTICNETIKFIVKKLSDNYFYNLNEKLKNNDTDGYNNLYNGMYMYIFGITGSTDLRFLISHKYNTVHEGIFSDKILNYLLQKQFQYRVDALMDTIETWLQLNLISKSEINELFEYFFIQYKCLENKQIIPLYSDEEVNLINYTLDNNKEVNYIEKTTEYLFIKKIKKTTMKPFLNFVKQLKIHYKKY